MKNDIKLTTLFKRLQHFAIDFEYKNNIFIPELKGVPIENIASASGQIIPEDYENFSLSPTLPSQVATNVSYSSQGSEYELEVDEYSNYRILVSFLHTRGLDKKVSDVFNNLDLSIQPLARNSTISELIDFIGQPENRDFLNNDFTNINREKAHQKYTLDSSLKTLVKPAVQNSFEYILLDSEQTFSDELAYVHDRLRTGEILSTGEFKKAIFDDNLPEFNTADQVVDFLSSDYDDDIINIYTPFLLSSNDDEIASHNGNLYIIPNPTTTDSTAKIDLYYQYDSGHDKTAISPLIDKSRLEHLYSNRKARGGTSMLDAHNNGHIWGVITQHIENDTNIDSDTKDLFLYGDVGGEDTGKGFIHALSQAIDNSNLPANLSFLSKFLSTHNHQEVESLFLYLSNISKTKPATPINYIKKEVDSVLTNTLTNTPISFSINFKNDSVSHDIYVDPSNPDKSILASVSAFMASNNAKSIDAILDDLDNDELTFVNLPNGKQPSFSDPIKENFKKALLAVSENPYNEDSQLKAFEYRPDLKPIVQKLPTSFFTWIKFTEQNNRKETVKAELQKYIDNGIITEAEASHIMTSHLIPKGPIGGNTDFQKIINKDGKLLLELGINDLNLTPDEADSIEKLMCSSLCALKMKDIEVLSDLSLQSLVQEKIGELGTDRLNKIGARSFGISNIALIIKNKFDFFNSAVIRAHAIKDNPHGNKHFEKSQALALDDQLAEHEKEAKELIPEPPTPKKIPPKKFKSPLEKFTEKADNKKNNSMTTLDNALNSCRTTKWLPENSTTNMVWSRLKNITKAPFVLSQDLLGVMTNDKYGDSSAALNFLKENLKNDKDAFVATMGNLAAGDTDKKSTMLRVLNNISDVTGAQWSKDIVGMAEKKNDEISKDQMEALETYIRNYKRIKYRGIASGVSPLTSKTNISTDPSTDPLSDITHLRDFSTLGNTINKEIKNNNPAKGSRLNLNNLTDKDFELLGKSPSVAAQDFIVNEAKKDKERDENQRRNLIIAELQRERENMRNISISPPKSIRMILGEFRDAVNDGSFSEEEGKAILRSFAPEHTQIHSVIGNDFDDFFNAVSLPVEQKRSSEENIHVSDHELSISSDPYSPKVLLDSSGVLSFKVPVIENGVYLLNDDNTLNYEVEITAEKDPLLFIERLKQIDPAHLLTQVACSGNPESYIQHLMSIVSYLGQNKLSIRSGMSPSAIVALQNKLLDTMGIDSDDIDDLVMDKLPIQLSDLERPDRPTNHRILKSLNNFNRSIEPRLFNFKPSSELKVKFNSMLVIRNNNLESTRTINKLELDIAQLKADPTLTHEDFEVIEQLISEQKSTGNNTPVSLLRKDHPNLYHTHLSRESKRIYMDSITNISSVSINALSMNNESIDPSSLLSMYKKVNQADDHPLKDDIKSKFANGIPMHLLRSDYPELFDLLDPLFQSVSSLSQLVDLIKPTNLETLIKSYPGMKLLINNVATLRNDYVLDLSNQAYRFGLLDIIPSSGYSAETLMSNLENINFPEDDDTLYSLTDEIALFSEIYYKDKSITMSDESQEADKGMKKKSNASIKTGK